MVQRGSSFCDLLFVAKRASGFPVLKRICTIFVQVYSVNLRQHIRMEKFIRWHLLWLSKMLRTVPSYSLLSATRSQETCVYYGEKETKNVGVRSFRRILFSWRNSRDSRGMFIKAGPFSRCSVRPTIYRQDLAIMATENSSRLSTPAFHCMTVYDAYVHSLWIYRRKRTHEHHCAHTFARVYRAVYVHT